MESEGHLMVRSIISVILALFLYTEIVSCMYFGNVLNKVGIISSDTPDTMNSSR